jgi:chaperonin GroES
MMITIADTVRLQIERYKRTEIHRRAMKTKPSKKLNVVDNRRIGRRVPVTVIPQPQQQYTPVPLGDRIMVQRRDEADTSRGGIIIPDVGKEKPQEGKVVYVGSEVKHLKPGDQILFGKYAGSEVQINNVALLIMREEEVQCRLDLLTLAQAHVLLATEK